MLIKYIDGNNYRNIYAVGDLHGEYHKLMNQLSALSFDFEQDLLIGVGDLCDRGPNSLECSLLINEDWFETTLGNHEDFCIKGIDDRVIQFYHEMSNNGGDWFYKQSDDIKQLLVNLYKTLPIMIELDYKGKKYGFVHANLPYDDWEHVKECVIKGDVIDDRHIIDHLIWSRDIANKDHVDIAFIDKVFIGHTPVGKPKKIGNVLMIDSGSVFFGSDLNIIKIGEE